MPSSKRAIESLYRRIDAIRHHYEQDCGFREGSEERAWLDPACVRALDTLLKGVWDCLVRKEPSADWYRHVLASKKFTGSPEGTQRRVDFYKKWFRSEGAGTDVASIEAATLKVGRKLQKFPKNSPSEDALPVFDAIAMLSFWRFRHFVLIALALGAVWEDAREAPNKGSPQDCHGPVLENSNRTSKALTSWTAKVMAIELIKHKSNTGRGASVGFAATTLLKARTFCAELEIHHRNESKQKGKVAKISEEQMLLLVSDWTGSDVNRHSPSISFPTQQYIIGWSPLCPSNPATRESSRQHVLIVHIWIWLKASDWFVLFEWFFDE